jgi:hypothetical protein
MRDRMLSLGANVDLILEYYGTVILCKGINTYGQKAAHYSNIV